ncbi:choice-of-anchor L domain-containing protein, partial [Psychroflexus maritimus]
MNKSFFFLSIAFFILFSKNVISQQIEYDTETYTLTELITDVLIEGECYDVNSVISPNNSQITNQGFESYGYFETTNPQFPFEDGIVLSSGNLGGSISGSSVWLGDDDLDLLSPDPLTSNATVIEFEFVPTVDQLNFNYVFASNEYPTFVCNFSDIFAFILSGPGIPDSNFYNVDGDPNTPDVEINVGGLNLALLPDSSIPVSITNVHENPNCSETSPGAVAYPDFFDADNISSGYSGMTVPLNVSATVIPGETYTIKLAVADYTDSLYDSAVFIEGSSLVFEIPEVVDAFECDSYILPEVNVGQYFTEPNGQGTNLLPGAEITENTTIYVYNDDSDSCFEGFEEASFEVNIYNLDEVDILDDVSECSSYTLPELENGNYFTAPNGQGNELQANDLITESQSIYIYASSGPETDGVVQPVCENESEFFVDILDPPPPPNLDNLEECGLANQTDFNLNDATSSIDPEVFEITFHPSQLDAENNENQINDVNPYTITGENETLWVRIFDGNCFAVNSFEIQTLPPPEINTPEALSECDFSEEQLGFTEFDLTTKIDEITDGNPNYEVEFFTTQVDAEDLTIENGLESPYTNENALSQTLFVRVTDITNGCASFTELELEINLLPVIAQSQDIPPLEACDDDQNGVQTLDITSQQEFILNDLEESNHQIQYYETQTDAENDENEILNATAFESAGQTIFVRVTETETSCFSFTSFELIVNEIPPLQSG